LERLKTAIDAALAESAISAPGSASSATGVVLLTNGRLYQAEPGEELAELRRVVFLSPCGARPIC
jgi:hypothetical protein